MLRHVVMWRIDDERLTEGNTKEAVASHLAARLAALKGVVAGLVDITAGAECVGSEGNWDLALVADFTDERALNDYATHPAHLEVVAEIRSVISQRAAVDFQICGAGQDDSPVHRANDDLQSH